MIKKPVHHDWLFLLRVEQIHVTRHFSLCSAFQDRLKNKTVRFGGVIAWFNFFLSCNLHDTLKGVADDRS